RPTSGGVSSPPPGSYKDDSVGGVKGAWAMGPFPAQAESRPRKLKADDNPNKDTKAKGYYAQLPSTPPGEPRQYKLEGAKFDSVKPENKEIGAWEVFYRYDNIKVEDDNVVADTATREVGDTKAKAHNLGVNWYVNDAVKISAAYVKAKT
ncbi:porin, partial [Pseudomonas aeruginosa]|uniref:porin n=1 Tax=Pseudomonas aeruginosa TaxID=287 RepID=UPI0020212AF7